MATLTYSQNKELERSLGNHNAAIYYCWNCPNREWTLDQMEYDTEGGLAVTPCCGQEAAGVLVPYCYTGCESLEHE